MALENYHLYRLAIWLAGHLPMWIIYGIAMLLAEANFLFDKRARRGVYANQSRVLPPETGSWQRWKSARAVFRSFAYAVVDFFRIPQMSSAHLDRFIGHVSGWEYLQAAMDSQKGVIFVTVHMGSWELAAAYLGLRGVPLTVVALPHKDTRIDAIYSGSREAVGIEVVPTGGAMRKLQQALRHGRFIALLSDRYLSGRTQRLPFFGQTLFMPDGYAVLALRTGAWILPGCTYRLPDRRLAIEIRPPIIPDPQTDTEESLARQCLPVLEEFIRSHPEQWTVFYDLWDAAGQDISR